MLGWISVNGDSMWPTLRSRDAVLCAPIPETLQVGSVIVAKLPSGVVAHRLVQARDGALVLRGDNCDRDDPPVSPELVLGVVTHVRRDGRELAFRFVDRGPMRVGKMRLIARRAFARARRLAWR